MIMRARAQVIDSLKIHEPKASKTIIKRMKWEVGTDLLWIFKKGKDDIPTFFLRKNTMKRKERFGLRKVAYRITAKIYFDQSRSDYNIISESFKLFTIAYLGYEWQEQVAARWQLFYGVDAGPFFYAYIHSYNSINEEHVEDTKRYGFELSPFVGLKFFIHSRVSISLENSISGSFYWDVIESNRKYIGSIIEEKNSKNRFFSSNLGFNPISRFNFSFYLK